MSDNFIYAVLIFVYYFVKGMEEYVYRTQITLSFPSPAKLNRYVFGKSRSITPEQTK
jgi:hypothetical protein